MRLDMVNIQHAPRDSKPIRHFGVTRTRYSGAPQPEEHQLSENARCGWERSANTPLNLIADLNGTLCCRQAVDEVFNAPSECPDD